MQKNDNRELRICPSCGRTYTEHPAISSKDNVTPICPDCGTREALASIGVSAEEQEHILSVIHSTIKQPRRHLPF